MKAPTPNAERAGEALSVRILEGADAFTSLGASWDALVCAQEVPNPTMTSTWLRHLVSWEPGAPLLILAERGETVVAGAAVGVRRPAGMLGPRVATWLGTKSYWYSPDLLVDPSDPKAAGALMDALLGHVDAVDLSVPHEGFVAKVIRDSMDVVEEQHGTEGWITCVPAPRLGYASRRADYELRRAGRRGATIETNVAREPGEITPALERAFELHRARWAGDPRAIHRFSSTEDDRAWYRRALAAMVKRDAARIVEVTEDGEPVSAIVGLRVGAGAMFHVMAVRPAQHLRQPGHVALLGWMNEAARSGATVMDLGWGAGDANSPKARFGPRRVPIVRLCCAHRSHDRAILRGVAELRRAARVVKGRLG